MQIKKYTTKDIIISTLTAVAVILNFLTLLFTVIKGGADYLSGSERYFSNGITLTFKGYPIIIEGCGEWLSFYCRFHFIASLAIIALLAVFWCIKRRPLGKAGMASMIAAELMSLIYFINGCVAYSVAAEFADLDLYFELYTLAFLPFLVITALFCALIAVKIKMPDNFSFFDK